MRDSSRSIDFIMDNRPVYLDLKRIHLPVTGWVSILHRMTGILLFLSLPLGLYLLQHSLASPAGFADTQAWLQHPLMRFLGVLVLTMLIFHVLAGLRHLALDLHAGTGKTQGRRSAAGVLIVSALLAVVIAWGIAW